MIPGGWHNVNGVWHWRPNISQRRNPCPGADIIATGAVFYPEGAVLCPACRKAFTKTLLKTQPRILTFLSNYLRVLKDTIQ